jgi:hypothetical protein
VGRHGKTVCVDPDCPPEGCNVNGEEIVVHAPKQRVVVRTPHHGANNCAPQDTGVTQAVPQAVPQAMPQNVMINPQAMAMGYPQQAMMPYGVQPMAFGMQPMGAVPFGMNAGAMSNATMTTNQRTRIGFTMTTIKIPIPWLKMIPIQDAPETTIKFSGTQQAMGFNGMPMGVGSLPGSPGSFVQGQVVGAPIGVTQAVGVQGVGAQGVGLQCPPCPPANPNAITPERVQALTKKIEELEAAKKAQDAKKTPEAPAPSNPNPPLPIPNPLPSPTPLPGK